MKICQLDVPFIVVCRIVDLPVHFNPAHFRWGVHQSTFLANKNILDNIVQDTVTPISSTPDNLFISRLRYDDGRGRCYHNQDVFNKLGLGAIVLQVQISRSHSLEADPDVDADNNVAAGVTETTPSTNISCSFHKIQVREIHYWGRKSSSVIQSDSTIHFIYLYFDVNQVTLANESKDQVVFTFSDLVGSYFLESRLRQVMMEIGNVQIQNLETRVGYAMVLGRAENSGTVPFVRLNFVENLRESCPDISVFDQARSQ
jgi:hypothetical protein